MNDMNKTNPEMMRRLVLPVGIGLLIAAIGLWALSLHSIDPNRMNDYGLVSVLPVAFIVAFVFLAAGFALFLTRPVLPERLLLTSVAALALFIHGTPNIVYGTLRYPWAFKHVGIVDYIMRHGSVDPSIPVLGVYHNWPGFFALNAFITQVGGFTSAMKYAGWAPLFFNLMFIMGLILLFRSLTNDRRVTWLGVWLFELGNWVGQDYFSPQAMGFLLYLLIIGVCLYAFNLNRPFNFPALSRPRLLRWTAPITQRLGSLVQTGRPKNDLSRSLARYILGTLILLLFLGVVSSHQLTPFIAIASLLALALFGYLRWWSLPLWMGSLTLLWMMFPANDFMRGETFFFKGIGQVGSNLNTSLVSLSDIGQAQATVAVMARVLTAVIGLLAAAGLIRRIRLGYLDLPVVLMAAAPVVMVGLNNYGGEILFRVFFFSLPFLVLLAAYMFFPDLAHRTARTTGTAIFALSLLMGIGFGFAYYGKERLNYARPDEITAMEYLAKVAPAHSLLVEGSHDYPTEFLNYEKFTYVPIDREPKTSVTRLIREPANMLDEWMSDKKYANTYFIITTSQKVFVDSIQTMPPGTLDYVEAVLRQSKGFKVFYQNENAVIFIHPN